MRTFGGTHYIEQALETCIQMTINEGSLRTARAEAGGDKFNTEAQLKRDAQALCELTSALCCLKRIVHDPHWYTDEDPEAAYAPELHRHLRAFQDKAGEYL